MVGQLSGKAGNTVASRNKAGSYFRTRVIPKLVRNARTTAVRSNLAYLAQNWRNLSSANQNGWIALGTNLVRLNSLGTTYSLTGLQAYESVNRNLFTLGSAFVSAAPVYAPPAALTALTLTASSV